MALRGENRSRRPVALSAGAAQRRQPAPSNRNTATALISREFGSLPPQHDPPQQPQRFGWRDDKDKEREQRRVRGHLRRRSPVWLGPAPTPSVIIPKSEEATPKGGGHLDAALHGRAWTAGRTPYSGADHHDCRKRGRHDQSRGSPAGTSCNHEERSRREGRVARWSGPDACLASQTRRRGCSPGHLSRRASCGKLKALDLRPGGLPKPWPRPAVLPPSLRPMSSATAG